MAEPLRLVLLSPPGNDAHYERMMLARSMARLAVSCPIIVVEQEGPPAPPQPTVLEMLKADAAKSFETIRVPAKKAIDPAFYKPNHTHWYEGVPRKRGKRKRK